MKKVVVSSLISVFILILIAGSFIYFQKFRSETGSALDAVPSDVAWLLSCDPSSGELRQLANTGFFNGADTIRYLGDWRKSLLAFDSIAVNTPEIREIFSSQPLILSGHVTGPRTFSTVYIVNLSTNGSATAGRIVQKLLRTSKNPGSRNYNGADIREFVNDKGEVIFAYVISKGIFIGSTTPYLVEDALRQQRSDKVKSPATALENFLRDAQRKSILAIRYEGFERWLQTNLSTGAANLAEFQKLGEWTTLRMDIHSSQLNLSGTTTVNDSTQFLHLFRDQQPAARKTASILLARTAACITWSFSNPQLFYSDYGRMLDPDRAATWENLNSDSLRKVLASHSGNELGLVVVKPLSGQTDYQYFGIMRLSRPDSCIAALKLLTKKISEKNIPEEQYNGTVIRMVPGLGLMPALFGPLFSKINRFYYTVIDSTMLVANQVSALRGYVNDYRLSNLLSGNKRFQSLETQLPAVSNIYFYAGIPQSEKLFTSVAAPQWTAWLARHSNSLRSWNGLSMTISSQRGVYKTTASLGYFADTLSVPQTEWKFTLDTSIVAGPFAPQQSSLIYLQDKRNVLHAIDREGKERWKKALESRIQGEVHTFIGPAGDTSCIFNSLSFIYHINQDGSNVNGFPVRLPAAASAGLAIERHAEETLSRLYIPCLNMKLMAYGLNGKPASGYSPFRLRQVVRTAPFILEQRNALLLAGESGGGYLVSSKGSIIHTIRQEVRMVEGTTFFADSAAPAGYAWLTPDGKYIRMGEDGIAERTETLGNGDSLTGAARMDLNGDGQADWLFTTKAGLRGTTADGVSLFVFTSENPMLSPVVYRNSLLAAADPSRIFVFSRNGSLYEGFPVAGKGTPIFLPGTDKTVRLIFLNDDRELQLMQFQ